MGAHGNTHLLKQRMKGSLLMKPEGGRKKEKVEWKTLQEVNKGNKGHLYASSYLTPEMAGLAKAPVFLIEKFSVIKALLVPRR